MIRLSASSTGLAHLQLSRSTVPLKINSRSTLCVNICRFYFPAPPGVFTPCSHSLFSLVPRSSTPLVQCSSTPPVPRSSNTMVGASALLTLLSVVAVAVLEPLDPSVPLIGFAFGCFLVRLAFIGSVSSGSLFSIVEQTSSTWAGSIEKAKNQIGSD